MEIQKLKQTVYLPVEVEKDNLPTKEVCALNESNMLVGHLKYLGEGVIRPIVYVEDEHQEMGNVTHWLKEQEVFVFTPEQLNEYTANVVRQALETAAEKVELVPHDVDIDLESITNTFEETFKLYQV